MLIERLNVQQIQQLKSAMKSAQEGLPKLEFLDENGKVTYGVPDNSATKK